MPNIPLHDWLLASQHPTIRYLTLRDLLDDDPNSAEMQTARAAIMTYGAVPAILAHQTPNGRWQNARTFYSPKYRSTHWSMLMLAELEADGSDERLQRGMCVMLEDTADTMHENLQTNAHGFECLWGNMLRYVVRFGGLGDLRTAAILTFLTRNVLTTDWHCKYNGELSCAWGAARTLWGLAAIPAGRRTPPIRTAIEHSIDFLFARFSPVEADYPPPTTPHALWNKLSFPLFYQADILFVLRALGEVKMLHHPGAQPALDWLMSRRGTQGRWTGSSPYRAKTWSAIANREDTQRWISLHAAIVLKRAGRLH